MISELKGLILAQKNCAAFGGGAGVWKKTLALGPFEAERNLSGHFLGAFDYRCDSRHGPQAANTNVQYTRDRSKLT